MSQIMFQPTDPPPYEIFNENGDAPFLIACDHADNRIPGNLDGLSIDRSLLETHIAYDIGAKQVAMILSSRFNAPLLFSNYSRLVIDLNRHLDDAGLIPEVSDGHDIKGNQGLSADHRNQRINEIFKPYHDAHVKLVDQLVGTHRAPIILSVHSFTPVMNGLDRPWHYGVLWDKCADLAAHLVASLRKNQGLCIGENQPYNAVQPKGYSMSVHAQDRGVDMGLIEIRQDLIQDPRGQGQAADILSYAMDDLMSEVVYS